MSATNSLDHLHQLRVELAKLADVKASNLNAPIPHIDGWTVHSTIGHTGWVARWVTESLTSAPDTPPSRSSISEPPAGEQIIAWFDDASRNLVDTIESIDLDELCPTFLGPQPRRWWLRRLSQEVAMHRWDAYSAFASPAPIDARLAKDGIDEILEVFVPNRMQFDKLGGTGETLHLHATDIDDGEWMLTLHPDKVAWEVGHAKGDAATRGPVSDLLLLLWSRLPPSRLEVFGDATILERWQSAASF